MRGILGRRTGPTRSLALFAAALVVGFGLAACSTIDNTLFGSDEETAEAPPPAAAPAPAQPEGLPGTLPSSSAAQPVSAEEGAAAPAGTAVTPVTIDPGSDTGTIVSKTIASLRDELSAMQGRLVAASSQLSNLKDAATGFTGTYNAAKANITTHLQVGTTRGNPELVRQWNTSQNALDSLTGNINSVNAIGTQVADVSSRAHYILSTIQATYNVSGAVDEDHRQLGVLEDETNQTIVLIDRLLKQISDDIQRQTAYVANERANLTTLAAAIKNGQVYGGALGMAPAAAPVSYGMEGGTPLVTIRFDRSNVDYQQVLYNALMQALQVRPGATFSVVGVSPTRGSAAAVQLAQTAAQRDAQQVLRSMTDMGVPGGRLNISSSTDPAIMSSEVRVYVR